MEVLSFLWESLAEMDKRSLLQTWVRNWWSGLPRMFCVLKLSFKSIETDALAVFQVGHVQLQPHLLTLTTVQQSSSFNKREWVRKYHCNLKICIGTYALVEKKVKN